MNHTIIPVNETAVNEAFNPLNNLFEGFQAFSSNLFLQISDGITAMLQSFLK